MDTKLIVYVVDDDAGARQSLAWLIQSAGHTVETCASATEFLQGSHFLRAGCVVLDCRMPGLSGIEMFEQLRQRDQQIPTVFVTGHGEVAACARAFRAGAVDFLEKPVADDVLLDRVDQALAKRRSQLASREIRNRYQKLTDRERETLHLLVAGRRLKEVAAVLQISLQTAAKHRVRILEKMQTENDVELADMIRRAGLMAREFSRPQSRPVRPTRADRT